MFIYDPIRFWFNAFRVTKAPAGYEFGYWSQTGPDGRMGPKRHEVWKLDETGKRLYQVDDEYQELVFESEDEAGEEE